MQPAIGQILNYEAMLMRNELQDISASICDAPRSDAPATLSRTKYLGEQYQIRSLALLPDIGPEIQMLFCQLDAYFQSVHA